MNILACCLLSALRIAVGELPPCDFADTECSTNLPVTVDLDEMSRIAFTVTLEPSPTNSLEVAIGDDANGEGNLSVEESAYTFGYDCGTWFCRDTGKNRLNALAPTPESPFPVSNRIERTFILKRHKLNTAWNVVKVTRRGTAPICECAAIEGRLPGLKLWIR